MVKRWLRSHVGLLLVLPLGLLLTFFPLHDGGILPDPLEMLFDWAGMIVAHSWISLVSFAINYSLVAIVAGLLDRAPLYHTSALLAGVTLLLFIGFPGSSEGWLSLPVGIIAAVFVCALYIAVRLLRNHLTRRCS